jgi:hypothetical protein
MRMADLQQKVAAREASMGRPDSGQSVTGHAMGRDTISPGDYKREFKDRNQLMGSMNTQTTLRAQATSQGSGEASDSNNDGKSYPNAGRATSNPNAVATRMNQDAHVSKQIEEPGDAKTAHEKEVTNKSAAGHQLGRDTFSIADAHRNYRDRNEMMTQMNAQTKMRAERTLAAQGGAEGSDRTFANAGNSNVSNPAHLSDNARAGLARLGFVNAGKKQSSADVEDKAK